MGWWSVKADMEILFLGKAFPTRNKVMICIDVSMYIYSCPAAPTPPQSEKARRRRGGGQLFVVAMALLLDIGPVRGQS